MDKRIPVLLASDFENTNDLINPRVWSYGILHENGKYYSGNSIEGWYKDLEKICTNKKKLYKVYFHNLKHDVSYVIPYLKSIGYTIGKDENQFDALFIKKDLRVLNFTIGSYQVQLIDNMLHWGGKLGQLGQSLGLKVKKGKIDYNKPREIGYEPDENEKEYQYNDCAIVLESQKYLKDAGFCKLTAASDALRMYRKTVNWKNLFPKVIGDEDKFIRKAYKGGICQVNPIYQNKLIKSRGFSLDANSMHPYQMATKTMPYGSPQWITETPDLDDDNYLYITRISVTATLKEGYFSCIPLGATKSSFLLKAEYATELHDFEMNITSVMLKFFLKSWDIIDIKFYESLRFKCSTNLFKEYVTTHYENKRKHGIEGKKALKQIDKLLLNSLYGKFGQAIEMDTTHFKSDFTTFTDKTTSPPKYVAVAAFTTSYSSVYLLENAYKLGKENVVYMDTDSLHCINLSKEEVGKLIWIDNELLGGWKIEYETTMIKALCPKRYAEYYDGHWNVHCGGMNTEFEEDEELSNKDIKIPKNNLFWKDFTIERFAPGSTWDVLRSRLAENGCRIIVEEKYILT